MKLKTINLENFKIIKSGKYDLNGESVIVYAENRRGKTTAFADSMSWLLFGKDSEGNSSPELTPIIDNAPQHQLETVVEGTFMLDDGKEVILKKAYKAQFGQKGKKKGQLLGHTVDHYINGDYIEKKQDYDIAVTMIANPKTFRLLTDPMYFNSPDPKVMPWKDRRNIVLQMAGVSEEEIKENDTRVKTLKKQKSDLEKKQQGKASEIAGAKANLPEVQAYEDGNVPALRKQLRELQDKKVSVANNGAVPMLNNQLAQAEADLLKARNQQVFKINNDKQAAVNLMNETMTQIKDIEFKVSLMRQASGRVLEEIKERESHLKSLKELFDSAQADKKDIEANIYNGDATCSYCGQSLPEDMKDKVEAAFNLQRSKSLEEKAHEIEAIKAKAKENNIKIQELKDQDIKLTKDINGLNNKIPALQNKEQEYKDKIEKLNGLLKVIDGIPEVAAFVDKKKAIEKNLEEAKKNPEVSTDEIDTEIDQLQLQISEAERIEAAINQRDQSLEGIKNMEAEEKKIAGELEGVEKELHDLEKKILNQAKALEEKINDMFEFISYRMFETTIDGEVVECCECINKEGVSVSNFSTSEEIRAGLDFIRRYSAFIGVDMPVIVDRRESIEVLPDMGSTQIISLYHKPGVKELKIEFVNNKEGVLV